MAISTISLVFIADKFLTRNREKLFYPLKTGLNEINFELARLLK
jgi:hypothetical protein